MVRRQLPEDFKDFIKFMNSNDVKYLLIGGWAVGLYGYPRATKDIDFLIAVDDENLKKMIKAIALAKNWVSKEYPFRVKSKSN